MSGENDMATHRARISRARMLGLVKVAQTLQQASPANVPKEVFVNIFYAQNLSAPVIQNILIEALWDLANKEILADE